jgi:PAS domain S-box-containing protein
MSLKVVNAAAGAGMPIGLESIQRANRELTHFFETASIPLHWVAPDGIIEWANQAELDLLGYSTEEYIGRNIADFHADSEVIADILARLSRGEKLRECPARLRTKSGEIRHVLIDSCVLWEDGRFVHTQCFTRDVTKTREADELYAHFSAIVESSDDAILSKDTNGIIRSWNKGAQRVFGYEAAEVIGQPVTILIPEGYKDEEPNILARIRRGERIDHYETVRQRKDGTLIQISLTVSPIKDAHGKVIGASKIARDITDQRRANELQRYFAAIVASSDDAILSKDLNGVIQSWNQGAQRMFGYTAEEVIGKPVTILMPEGRKNEEPTILSRVRRGERIDHYETIRQRKDGALIDISLTVSPIKDDKGTVIGASKIARDISERKTAERVVQQAKEELARANEELEQRVKERTASLNEVVAQLEEFSYSVSHDLRGPTRAMQGYARAVIEDYGHLLDDTGRDYLERIVRGSTRMDKLTQDVLTYSRLARNQVELKPVSLDALIREVVQYYPEMQPPSAEITIFAPLYSVLAHEPSLTQAVANLLGNAVKFVAAGVVPKVKVSAEGRGANVRIWFKDNGIGIKPEYQARLFGIFERANQDARYDGTGIGLAIVRKAIEKMGGTVGFESDGRHGSSFWIELRSAE